MKLAIISDSHDNIPNLEKFCQWAEARSIDQIIHCGDLASGETLALLSKNFDRPIHLVYGNMDFSRREDIKITAQELPQVELHGEQGELLLMDESGRRIKIAFCHFPETARELALTGKYQLVFFGHTHKPWMETLDNKSQLINPGTLGGVFNKATFAVFDTANSKLELKLLELL